MSKLSPDVKKIIKKFIGQIEQEAVNKIKLMIK